MKTCSLKEISSEIKTMARKSGANFNKIKGNKKVAVFLHAIKQKQEQGYKVTIG